MINLNHNISYSAIRRRVVEDENKRPICSYMYLRTVLQKLNKIIHSIPAFLEFVMNQSNSRPIWNRKYHGHMLTISRIHLSDNSSRCPRGARPYTSFSTTIEIRFHGCKFFLSPLFEEASRPWHDAPFSCLEYSFALGRRATFSTWSFVLIALLRWYCRTLVVCSASGCATHCLFATEWILNSSPRSSQLWWSFRRLFSCCSLLFSVD